MLSCCVLLGSFSTTSGLLSAALWIMTDGCVRNETKLITTIKYGDIIHLHHTAFGEGLCPSFEEILIPFTKDALYIWLKLVQWLPRNRKCEN